MLSSSNLKYKQHTIIYLIFYKIDPITNANIYKIDISQNIDFMIINKYYLTGRLLYQRVIENSCNNIMNEIINIFTSKYKTNNKYDSTSFEGDYNDMINTINDIIKNNFKNGHIMNNKFTHISNIPLVSPKSQKYTIYKNTNSIEEDLLEKNLTNQGFERKQSIPYDENIIPTILKQPVNDSIFIESTLAIKSIEKNSKESPENIKKYVDCLSLQRIKDNHIKIGNCLQNIDDTLFDIWNNLNNDSYKICMSSPSWLWYKMIPNSYNIADLKYWATVDNPEKVFNIIESDIIRSVNKIGDNISPYNLTMISYKHFKHFHIYTNNRWYYYDTITNKWDEDMNKMNITQSLISNISIIFERYTNYDNIVKMYSDKLFIDEVLNIAANIFFNKNNYSNEYISYNLISHNNLP